MFNPAEASQKIKDEFVDYLSTTFSIADEDYYSQFIEKLHKTGAISKGPLIEINDIFKSGHSIEYLYNNNVLSKLFVDIEATKSNVLPYKRKLPVARSLYLHQEKAIDVITTKKLNAVITTGTGSGKTECFLIPIINDLLREKEKGTLSKPGVRAILIYPMNALANDQMKRLRELLMFYPDITFGVYNGDTKKGEAEAKAQYIDLHSREACEELRHPLDNEYISRDKMNETPPHILCTNYAMLEHMMLRPENDRIFTNSNFKYVVLDEAHIYTGATGMETALLLRRLKARIGGEVRPQFILTSATLGKKGESERAIIELDYKRERFNALIKEQCNLLDYLEEQRSAVINGAAGTGKTMIAIEKARRHSANGESVLFLCFNSKLKDFLEINYKYPNVEYYTIDGFACKLCNSQTADFEALELQIIELVENNQFPYTHIIIDEGQDLGQERIQSTKILELLEEIVLSKPTGTFYVFYDKLQLVQSYQLPKLIQEADCKLTLYKNCRNTKKIAETSFKPLKTVPKLFESALNGNLPIISFVDEINKLKALDEAIKKGIANGITDIQIISCAPTDKSTYQANLSASGNYLYNGKEIKFTTCRKFKGLEADMVILVDVDYSVLRDNNMLFYVGASRARLELSILCNFDDDKCSVVISDWGGFVKKNNPKQTLSKMLGCKLE